MIHDLNVARVAIDPAADNAPLVVDSERMVSCQGALQSFQAAGWCHGQVRQPAGRVHGLQLALGAARHALERRYEAAFVPVDRPIG
jgi:hypothetical protein